MFELICQQRYRAHGVPVDLTRYRNHGTAIDSPPVPTSDPARAPIQFPNPDSCVSIGLGALNAWNPLVALKIEVDARLNQAPEPGLKLGLVHGDGSFAFYLNSTTDGTSNLVAQIAGPPITDLRTVGATAPLKRWVTLGLSHDGFSTLQLLVDGKVIGETSVITGVPPVQAGGVVIGNGPSGGAPLLSEINEVRIWRLDPNQMKREFLCRPYTAATAKCWEALFRAMRQWRTNDPSGSSALIERIVSQQRSVIRAFFLLPKSEQAEGNAILAEFNQQWCKGHIDHSRMRHVIGRWTAFLHLHELDANSGPSSDEIRAAIQGSGVDLAKLNLECDPAALAFFEMLGQEFQSVNGKLG